MEDKEAQTKLVDSNSSLLAVQQDPARMRRASSVQRQTESLRRLAQSRDVTPMLQTPMIGIRLTFAVFYSNPNLFSSAEFFRTFPTMLQKLSNCEV